MKQVGHDDVVACSARSDEAPGIGLAAPQIGIMKRLLVMDCVKEEDQPPKPMVLVNPEVIWETA